MKSPCQPLYVAKLSAGVEALVACGMMEALLKVINWYSEGQEHITVRKHFLPDRSEICDVHSTSNRIFSLLRVKNKLKDIFHHFKFEFSFLLLSLSTLI